MNLCFFTGKVITDIEFKFIIEGRNVSVAIFEILLTNENIIKVKAYDEMADYCYSKLNKGDIVSIQGEITSKAKIIINDIEDSYLM